MASGGEEQADLDAAAAAAAAVPGAPAAPAALEAPEAPETPEDNAVDSEATAPAGELERRLREAGPEELMELVRERAAELSPAAVQQALRNPFVTAEVVEELAAHTRLLSFLAVRRDLVRCRATPEPLALRLLAVGLYWADLLTIGVDSRLNPRLRRAAELQLLARLPGLAVGERISIARRAPPAVLNQLRHDPTPRVIAALLDNPRLVEGTLAPLVHSELTPAPVLELIAADRRWGVRYQVRLALARNPALPVGTALRLLPLLRKADLRGLASDPRLGEALRRRARLLLGDLAGDGA